MHKHGIVDIGLLRHLRHIAHARQFLQHAGYTTHTFHLLDLVAKILQIKTPALLELGSQFLRFFVVEFLLGLFDQAEHIAHTQDPRCQPIRVKGLEGIGFLAHTQKLDGLAGNRSHRQRGAAPGVGIGFGQDDTGQRQRLIKCPGRGGGILAGHGIHHKQGFDGLYDPVQVFDLLHHGVIDGQATRGIDQQHIDKLLAGFINSSFGNIHRLLIRR